MNDLRRILLIDTPEMGNEEAVARAVALAKQAGVKVQVLAPIGHVPSLFPGSDLDVAQLVVDEHRRRLDATVTALRAQGVDAQGKVRVGVPVVEIVREVLEWQAQLCLKVSDAGGSRGSKFGSADLQLLRKCPCPVWITKPRDRVPYRRIVAAIDPSDERPGRDAGLDAKILRWAADIARLDAAELVVVHAWELIGETLLSGGRGRIPAEDLRRLLDETRAAHAAKLTARVASCDLAGVRHVEQLVKGRADRVIAELVERERADLLVMGTVARSGIVGFVIGNTAEQILQELACAVIAVKPDGFVSPIRLD